MAKTGNEYRGGDTFALRRGVFHTAWNPIIERASGTEPLSQGQVDECTCAGVLMIRARLCDA